ncbi:MAG: hypothetical protein H6908_05415 [Hyphomicrobiales bacterium]|nr:hypothetical protein [Hyphomicrobiales bacterium]
MSVGYEYFPESLAYLYKSGDMQRYISEALQRFGKGDGNAHVLSNTKWEFQANLDLDDTGDTSYKSPIFSEEDMLKVVATTINQHLNQGKKIVIRRIEKVNKDSGYQLVLSAASMRALKGVCPSIQLGTMQVEAGRPGKLFR